MAVLPVNNKVGQFPTTRLRRNRQTDWSRRLVSENTVTVNDLIWPIFMIDGESHVDPVVSMPGVERITIDLLVDNVGAARDLGIPTVAIFPYLNSELKTSDGREAINPNNLVCRAVRAIREADLEVGVLCDVAPMLAPVFGKGDFPSFVVPGTQFFADGVVSNAFQECLKLIFSH